MLYVATAFVIFTALLIMFTLYMAWEHARNEANAEREKAIAELAPAPTPAT